MSTKKLQILGSLGSDDALTIDLEDAEQGTAHLTNSDQLGGLPASNYVLKSEVPTFTYSNGTLAITT